VFAGVRREGVGTGQDDSRMRSAVSRSVCVGVRRGVGVIGQNGGSKAGCLCGSRVG